MEKNYGNLPPKIKFLNKFIALDLLSMQLCLIDWIVIYAVSAIFQPYNGAMVLWKKLWYYGKNLIQYRKVWNFYLIWKKQRYIEKTMVL